ncbi:MAG: hypothetical protein IKU51_05945 [Clostridia bacterium]|nr:hypothetical protein [Clostridia bacterium]
MKHRLTTMVALLAALLLLVGCGDRHPDNVKTPVTDRFSCVAQIAYGEMEAVARLRHTAEGKLTATFSEPKSLSGVTVGWDGEGMTLELGGMSLAIPQEKVPQSALVACLMQVLEASHPAGSRTEDGYVIEGEAEGMAYTLVCDPDTGLPRSLSVPEQELEATFTEVTASTE